MRGSGVRILSPAPLNIMKYGKLKVMADFCSSGIWRYETGVMVDFEDSDIPKELIKSFEDWVEFYDSKCHTPRHYAFKEEMAEELNNRGRDLAKKLKIALPNTQIFFRGEISGDMLDLEEITGV